MNRKEAYRHIPESLKTTPNWMVYRLIHDRNAKAKDGKPSKPRKIPFDAKTGNPGSSTDPSMWSDFNTAMAALESDRQNDGLAFAIVEPFVFVDLDKCHDPETGTTQEWALEIMADLQSYTELSPSGTGFHILCQSTKPLPPTGRKKGDVEMYGDKRYFTMTGNQVPGTPSTAEDCTEELLVLHQCVFGNSAPESSPIKTVNVPAVPATASDEAIIATCRNAKNGEKFLKLFDNGDTSAYGGDESVADAALCAILAYRTRDSEQIDRIFRSSALMRAKWDEKRGSRTYGQRTIDNAIKLQKAVPTGFSLSDEGVFYQPPATDDGEMKPPIQLSSRLEVIAATRNSEGGEWGRLLRWRDPEGRLHTWAMPMSMLAGDGNEIIAELLAGGLFISPNRKGREIFKIYLQESVPSVLMKSVNRVGWHDDYYVFPDATVGGTDDGEEVVFQSPGLDHQFTVSGSLEEWKTNVASPCVGNPRLVFGVSVAFAAPLLQTVDGESGGFQFVGPSSMGKSTALRVAASVNGGKNYVRSWRSTANGL